jgi:hypothetical protein
VKLRLIDPPKWQDPPVEQNGKMRHLVFEEGDCWYASQREDGRWTPYPDAPEAYRYSLTIAPEHAGKVPIMVLLPGEVNPDCLHAPTQHAGGFGASGWRVEGEAPNLTVTPSIHIVGRWHGFITNGELRTC